MKELILYIKMKRGLSITAYQFHKLLKYEDDYLTYIKNKTIQNKNYIVPKGDKHDKLLSNSMKYLSLIHI